MQEFLSDEKSIYLQISERIETDILRGILLEEERVPSKNELAVIYTINPATAGKGVTILADEGILYKKRGIGMFVAEGARAKILEKRRKQFEEKSIREVLREAKHLGINTEELIDMIRKADRNEQV